MRDDPKNQRYDSTSTLRGTSLLSKIYDLLKNHEQVLSALAALTAITAAFWVTLKKSATLGIRKMNGHSSNEMNIEYWRLFGPSVPRMMELLQYDPAVIERDSYHVYIAMPRGRDVVEWKFWASYCVITHKRKFVTANRWLWQKYCGKRDEGRRLDFLAKPADLIAIDNWIEDNYVDQSGDIERPSIERNYDQERFGVGAMLNDVGFLFMNLRNDSAYILTDVEVKFMVASVSETLPQVQTPYRWPWNDIVEAFKTKGDPSNYLLTNDLVFEHEETFHMATWEQGLEVAFLMATYRSDQDGFENGYLDDAFKLKSISGKIGGKRVTFNVRGPLREKALREKVPYGWFRQ